MTRPVAKVTRRLISPELLWAQAGHDLRQPIQSLVLLTRVLSAHVTGEVAKQTIGHMVRSLQNLQAMLDALIRLARLDAGLERPQVGSCEMAVLVAGVARDLDATASGRGIALRIRSAGGFGCTDAALLELIVRSLVLIALKIGGGSEVVIGWRTRPAYLVIEVEFPATSSSAEQAGRMFCEVPGATVEAPVAEVALGIDLLDPLCQLLGLRLDMTSRRGKVQRFTLMIPRAEGVGRRRRGGKRREPD